MRVVTITGPAGCGKTTQLNNLANQRLGSVVVSAQEGFNHLKLSLREGKKPAVDLFWDDASIHSYGEIVEFVSKLDSPHTLTIVITK